jgi:hypothetical protein
MTRGVVHQITGGRSRALKRSRLRRIGRLVIKSVRDAIRSELSAGVR